MINSTLTAPPNTLPASRSVSMGRFKELVSSLRTSKFQGIHHLLPMMFNLRGKPYTLKDHFVFEPIFQAEMPLQLTLMCARQVGKSQSLSARSVMQAAMIPYIDILYVTPLYEMARRTSNNYVRPLIEESPLRKLLVDSSCNHSVLQRSFVNFSNLHFSYAMLDATRIRGVPADAVIYDEAQDFDPLIVPIIAETLNGSENWGYDAASGTPRTLDTYLEKRWVQSSQAQWHITCEACNYENIPSREFHLDKMMGPARVRREISEAKPGCVCAKCDRPIFPRTGRWVHHKPELRFEHAGYHVPRILMPRHYADKIRWRTLLAKRSRMTPAQFYNEACGESYDFGAKLISQTELIRAARGGPNTMDHARKIVDRYVNRVLAVDWSGGGETESSTTVMAAIGFLPNGNCEVFFAHRFVVSHDYLNEAVSVAYVMQQLRCRRLVHDFGGAGALREHLLRDIGIPANKIVPCVYQRIGVGPLMRYKQPSEETGQRAYWQIDKARSLIQTCHLIRYGGISFFESDYGSQGQVGLLDDFTSLIEHRMESFTGSEVTTIKRSDIGGPDDFAQAVNIGVCALHNMNGHTPDLAGMANYKLDPQIIREMFDSPFDWDSLD